MGFQTIDLSQESVDDSNGIARFRTSSCRSPSRCEGLDLIYTTRMCTVLVNLASFFAPILDDGNRDGMKYSTNQDTDEPVFGLDSLQDPLKHPLHKFPTLTKPLGEQTVGINFDKF